MPLIVLTDLGKYTGGYLTAWVAVINGMTLKLGTQHISWADLAKDFTAMTGWKTTYKNLTLGEYFASDVFPNIG
jgi:hypothetical protein